MLHALTLTLLLTAQPMTLDSLISSNGITMTAREVSPMRFRATDSLHVWRLIVKSRGGQMQILSLSRVPPSLYEIMDDLLGEWEQVEELSFDDWCEMHRASPDSRRALASYQSAMRHHKALAKLLSR